MKLQITKNYFYIQKKIIKLQASSSTQREQAKLEDSGAGRALQCRRSIPKRPRAKKTNSITQQRIRKAESYKSKKSESYKKQAARKKSKGEKRKKRKLNDKKRKNNLSLYLTIPFLQKTSTLSYRKTSTLKEVLREKKKEKEKEKQEA